MSALRARSPSHRSVGYTLNLTSRYWSKVLQKHEGWKDVLSPVLPTGQGSKDFGPKHQAGAGGSWASPSGGPNPVLFLCTAGRSHPVPPRLSPSARRGPSVDLPFPGFLSRRLDYNLTAGQPAPWRCSQGPTPGCWDTGSWGPRLSSV